MKTSILFTGSNGFPFGSADIQRQIQLANVLCDKGYQVIVINRRGAHSKMIAQREKISTIGNYNNIIYIYCSLLPYKSRFFLKRNIFKLFGVLSEFFVILYNRIFRNAKFLFNNSIKLNELKFYYYLAKILKMELVYDYVELVSSLGNREKDKLELSKNSFDNQFFKYADKFIVISSYLDNYMQKLGSDLPRIKIPPIINFSYIDGIKPKVNTTPYFLFCGSAAYKDIIFFIIDSFLKSKSIQNGCNLRLVVQGAVDEIKAINKYIKDCNIQDNVLILSNLPYEVLISYYKSARALLIPLNSNLQDQARFPFKICEYVASKRPIVTTNVNLINEYFEDNKTAIIAENYDLNYYAKKLNTLCINPAMSDEIGENAYVMGLKIFNYKSYSTPMNNLLKN